ncbi:hypothetical protein B0H13DRAFT_2107604 [Mycena leptocephala]|nr:hypothetical protein B0H13DRAFT_2107604 [Mycena leptocephala]
MMANKKFNCLRDLSLVMILANVALTCPVGPLRIISATSFAVRLLDSSAQITWHTLRDRTARARSGLIERGQEEHSPTLDLVGKRLHPAF